MAFALVSVLAFFIQMIQLFEMFCLENQINSTAQPEPERTVHGFQPAHNGSRVPTFRSVAVTGIAKQSAPMNGFSLVTCYPEEAEVAIKEKMSLVCPESWRSSLR